MTAEELRDRYNMSGPAKLKAAARDARDAHRELVTEMHRSFRMIESFSGMLIGGPDAGPHIAEKVKEAETLGGLLLGFARALQAWRRTVDHGSDDHTSPVSTLLENGIPVIGHARGYARLASEGLAELATLLDRVEAAPDSVQGQALPGRSIDALVHELSLSRLSLAQWNKDIGTGLHPPQEKAVA